MCRSWGMPSYILACAWKVKHFYGGQGVSDHRECFDSVVLVVRRNGASDPDREPWSLRRACLCRRPWRTRADTASWPVRRSPAGGCPPFREAARQLGRRCQSA
ncbi:hypothetical protein HPB47_012361 [Ixodes persulcatus]|uniref:Uncharacterized protein n=1 Tax=Ixodes persulcatus TaxID=34615 RepID=A0AC60NTR4_IXOPE|nr:hypothetical protein HPB47_012361 [Ixodes persulcatus]